MFSGIIEGLGEVKSVVSNGSNKTFGIICPFTSELKVDQSVSHNGVCLTVVKIENGTYYVDAIDETLKVTNLEDWSQGSLVNLERSVRVSDRLDGHIVQGHVDQVAVVDNIENEDGSWTFHFKFEDEPKHVMIPKGSVCINGVSLTISGMDDNGFQVSIIPYTFEHTNFKDLKVGQKVNIEFDVIGKYLEKLRGAH